MLDLLVLYTLNEYEKSGYQINKEILKNFGSVMSPSSGSIHPVLNKLLKLKCINQRTILTDGGKKSNLYSLTKEGTKYFNLLFQKEFNFSASDFRQQIYTRILTISFANIESKKIFFDYTLFKLNDFILDIENRLHNQYLKYNVQQEVFFKFQISELKNLINFIEKISNK